MIHMMLKLGLMWGHWSNHERHKQSKIVSLGGNIFAKELDGSGGIVRAWVDIGVIVE